MKTFTHDGGDVGIRGIFGGFQKDDMADGPNSLFRYAVYASSADNAGYAGIWQGGFGIQSG